MAPHRAQRRGFSLVEMVAALAIFSLSVVAVLDVYTVCLRANIAAENYTRAAFLGQGVMEETLATGQFVLGTASGDFAEMFPGATYTVEIAESDVVGLYDVRVVVDWSERGQDKSMELRTLAAGQ